MRHAPIIAGALAAVLVAVLMNAKRAEARPGNTLWTDSVSSWLDNLTQDAAANEARYRPHIAQAEAAHGIPAGLLARLIYQESRYRTDIITGQVVSSAGAVGIAQIVPRWHPGVDPLDPLASIRYAARYLAGLAAQFGSWREALAAYNWGPGNLSNHLARFGQLNLAALPEETRDYVSDIADDVGVA